MSYIDVSYFLLSNGILLHNSFPRAESWLAPRKKTFVFASTKVIILHEQNSLTANYLQISYSQEAN